MWSYPVRFVLLCSTITVVENWVVEEGSKRLTYSKIRLDRIETHTEKSSQREPESLLVKLPIPKLIVPPKGLPDPLLKSGLPTTHALFPFLNPKE